MPEAREYNCKVLEKKWLTSSVFMLRFQPSKSFHYQPGQFCSVIIDREGHPRARRIYSFSSGGKGEYELCVQVVENGLGSNYLSKLEAGDTFKASAPYGDFLYDVQPHQNVCFIATGTGIAPFKAMAMSKHFRDNIPAGALLLFGARTPEDVLYPGVFESKGIEVVNAISRQSPELTSGCYRGRLTDYLKSLPEDWPWQSTVFYICGNSNMVQDVSRFLKEGKGVPTKQVRYEIYFAAQSQAQMLHMPQQQNDERKGDQKISAQRAGQNGAAVGMIAGRPGAGPSSLPRVNPLEPAAAYAPSVVASARAVPPPATSIPVAIPTSPAAIAPTPRPSLTAVPNQSPITNPFAKGAAAPASIPGQKTAPSPFPQRPASIPSASEIARSANPNATPGQQSPRTATPPPPPPGARKVTPPPPPAAALQPKVPTKKVA